MRRVAIVAAVVAALLVAGYVVARWLIADSVERAAVTDLLRAQGRGDAAAVLGMLERCDAACAQAVRRNASRLRRPGELRIARYDSQTARALRSQADWTRVVWFLPGMLPTVQCVLVRRNVDVVAGTTVSLLRLTAPIGRQSSCPS